MYLFTLQIFVTGPGDQGNLYSETYCNAIHHLLKSGLTVNKTCEQLVPRNHTAHTLVTVHSISPLRHYCFGSVLIHFRWLKNKNRVNARFILAKCCGIVLKQEIRQELSYMTNISVRWCFVVSSRYQENNDMAACKRGQLAPGNEAPIAFLKLPCGPFPHAMKSMVTVLQGTRGNPSLGMEK